jgi:DNA-directed RNA polymerase subunit B
LLELAEISKEDTSLILKAFFKDKGLVRQHLDSYNEFIDHGLQEVIDEVGEISIEVPENPYKVKLGQIWIIDPQTRITGPYTTEVDGTKHEIYPMEARLRNLSYAAPVALEMTPVIDGREQDTELVYVGNIPVMFKTVFSLTTFKRRTDSMRRRPR